LRGASAEQSALDVSAEGVCARSSMLIERKAAG
jgi:hypothetical protein